MPQRDRTGPMGRGPGSGLGLGDCDTGTDSKHNGLWLAASLAGAVALELTRKDSVVRQLAGKSLQKLKSAVAARLPGSTTEWERITDEGSERTKHEMR
ncbi:hypothetical protein GF324_08315 [bacterium]|nr:hypothetical protein [bacterium]